MAFPTDSSKALKAFGLPTNVLVDVSLPLRIPIHALMIQATVHAALETMFGHQGSNGGGARRIGQGCTHAQLGNQGHLQ